MKKHPRYKARALDTLIDAQGRRRDWVARQAGISPALLTLAVAGERTLGAPAAERIAAALGVPLFMAFEPAIEGTALSIAGNEEAD